MEYFRKMTAMIAMVTLALAPQYGLTQVSKPKAPSKVKKVPYSSVIFTEDFSKAILKLDDKATVGQLYDSLSSGISRKNQEQLLKTFSSSKQWRNVQLPKYSVSDDSVTLTVLQNGKKKTLTFRYVFYKDVFATINNQPIFMTDLENPQNVMNRIKEIVSKQLGVDKGKKQASWLYGLFFAKAHAGSFGLSIGVGFITQIFSMIMMYKMMKTFTKAFNRPQPNHYHYYYPPTYGGGGGYYPPNNPYGQTPANPYYGAPYGGVPYGSY